MLEREALANALVERAQILFVVGVVEAEHRLEVLDLGEALGGTSADALRRRIRRQQLGMRGFERLELVHQRVEVGVADLGRGLYVVQLFVTAYFLAEMLDAFGGGHR